MQQGVEDRFSQLIDAVRSPARRAGAGRDADRGRVRDGQEPRARAPGPRGAVGGLRGLQGGDLQGDAAARPGQGVPGRHRAAPRSPAARARPSTRSPPACSSTLPAIAELYRWAHQEDAPVDSRFAATLFLHEYARGDEEFADRIVRFWAGDPLPVADLRRRLKEAGAAATYRLAAIKERDLSRQRFRFVSRLMQAAGHGGWVVLLDEVELIGRYTSLQRAKSYAEIARWVRGDRDDPAAPDLRRAHHRRRLRDPGAGRQERHRAHPQAAPGQGDGRGRAAGRPGRGRDADHRTRAGAAAASRAGGAGPHLRPAQADPRRGVRLGPARRGRASSGCRPTACASTCGPGSTSGTCAGSTPPTSPRSARAGLDVDLSTDSDLEGRDEED